MLRIQQSLIILSIGQVLLFFLLDGCTKKNSYTAFSTSTSTLSDKDFIIADMNLGIDSSQVIQLVGHPDSITSVLQEKPSDSLNKWWCYHNLKLMMRKGNNLHMIGFVRKGIMTARGIGVGDSINRLYALYGAAIDEDTLYKQLMNFMHPTPSPWLHWCDRNNQRMMAVKTQDSLISEIYIGYYDY